MLWLVVIIDIRIQFPKGSRPLTNEITQGYRSI
jgi:hypothetical protein